jgi:hypothetical protein
MKPVIHGLPPDRIDRWLLAGIFTVFVIVLSLLLLALSFV